MPNLTAERTLVKSPPELWAELSEVDRLAQHLDAFGEIRITKLEPEHTVAWEGEHASGTVSIEPSGWGTKVTLEAALEGSEEPPPIVEEPTPAAPAAQPGLPPLLSEVAGRGSLLARWLFRPRSAHQASAYRVPPPATAIAPAVREPAPATEPPPQPAAGPAGPEAGNIDPEEARAVLDGVLDTLGAAHHRPFSRG
jgi:hypothetical protein